MKKRNIYQKQSQELLHLFEEAGSSAKVMCVPMDYEKSKLQKCLIYNVIFTL